MYGFLKLFCALTTIKGNHFFLVFFFIHFLFYILIFSFIRFIDIYLYNHNSSSNNCILYLFTNVS